MPAELDPRSEAALVEALEDYHRKASLGEPVSREAFAERLGPTFAAFEAMLDAEQALDDAMVEPSAADEGLPRAFGSYTLIRELGRGGVGVVYEAVDRRLGRSVAVKVLKVSFEDDPVALERFRREAAACARVRHDHIVAIFEAGEVEGQPYYAMDIVPGEPLEAAIRAGRAPAPRDLCRELAKVADALQLLHDAGIVHRDVKPPNIMVRPDGRFVLTDFGLARTPGSMKLTRTGAAVGTPLYMSPEQFFGKQDRIDARTDVYGLGTVLYEALTGRPPFDTREMPRLIYMIGTQRPEALRAVNPAVPEPCERITLKALEKEPGDRYASAAAMAADLRAFAEDRSVMGRPLPHSVRVLRWAKHRWVPLVAAAALAGVGVWAWGRRPATYVLKHGAPADLTVWIDEQERGRPPDLVVTVKPGVYRVEYRHPLFESEVIPDLELEAGEKITDRLVMLSPREGLEESQQDEATRLFQNAMARVSPRLGHVRLPKRFPETSGVLRAHGDPLPPLVLLPRGRMRARDLVTWWVELNLEHEARGGRLELRRGQELLWSEDLSPERLVPAGPRAFACGAFPLDLASRVRAAQQLVMAWVPGKGQEAVGPQSAMIEIVPSDEEVDRALEDVAVLRLRDPWDSRYRIEILRSAGLFAAALREAVTQAASTRDRSALGSVLRILRDDLQLLDAVLVDELAEWDRRRDGPPPPLCSSRR